MSRRSSSLLCSLALARRGERTAAVLWAAAFAVGVAIEVLVKHVVQRPALTEDGSHLVGFDGSLPSGHTLRALLLATAAWHVSRRLGRVALAWAATIPPVLVAAGWHTPSDVLAGIALALLLVAVTAELLRLRTRPRPAA